MTRPIRILNEFDRVSVINRINKLPLNDNRGWDLTISRHRDLRSLNQNALFHKWVGIAAAEFGNENLDAEEMKEELKRICDCPMTEYEGLDGETHKVRRTSKLDTGQMSAFMDRVYRFLSIDMNLILPVPEYAETPQADETKKPA